MNLISSDITNLATEAFDAIINDWGKTCRLYYPPKYVACANCVNGVWKTGGPMPFTFGLCPLCNSKGTITSEVYTDIKMVVGWKANQWIVPISSVNMIIANSNLITKGFISDLPKILRCDTMAIMNLDAYAHFTFKLNGEPVDQGSIVQGRYFMAMWVRA